MPARGGDTGVSRSYVQDRNIELRQKDDVTFSVLAPATVAEQAAIAEVLSDVDAELATFQNGTYAAGHILAGGYRQNPLEVVAYDLQTRFDSNQKLGNVEPFIRRQLDERIAPMLEG